MLALHEVLVPADALFRERHDAAQDGLFFVHLAPTAHIHEWRAHHVALHQVGLRLDEKPCNALGCIATHYRFPFRGNISLGCQSWMVAL